MSRSVIAEVERTREPILIADAPNDGRFAAAASILDLRLQSILCFPLKTTRSFLGVVYADTGSATRRFRGGDLDRMIPFAAQAAVAVENAFAFRKIRELYEETLSVARAREKILDHVSHELATPLALVRRTLEVFERGLAAEAAPSALLRSAMERGKRSLERLVDLQRTMTDIYEAKWSGAEPTDRTERIELPGLLSEVVARARGAAPGRQLEIAIAAAPGIEVFAPRRPLEVAIESLLKNAIENTPDEGRIELLAAEASPGLVEIAVRDAGVGITPESQKHLFDGFYHTQDTESYASRRAYDFDAGGKGLDLQRVRAFAQRHGWEVSFESARCGFLTADAAPCPGRISSCSHCKTRADCLASGGSTFRIALAGAAPRAGAAVTPTPPSR
jgi:signal transduction histidine kinase